MRQTLLALAASLALGAALVPAAPAEAHDGWRRGHGRHWHGHHHHRGHHWHGGPRTSFHLGIGVWRSGYWHHGWYGPRFGWWWVVPSAGYYYYPAPVYPYPDYYRPSVVVIERQAPPPAIGAPPQQYWYYCEQPDGYYPYVPECDVEWRKVPATPQDD